MSLYRLSLDDGRVVLFEAEDIWNASDWARLHYPNYRTMKVENAMVKHPEEKSYHAISNIVGGMIAGLAFAIVYFAAIAILAVIASHIH